LIRQVNFLATPNLNQSFFCPVNETLINHSSHVVTVDALGLLALKKL
jgi:hypothetical protein